jgi:hypothetical protein
MKKYVEFAPIWNHMIKTTAITHIMCGGVNFIIK